LHSRGGDVMGVDWRINIDQAWMDISYRSAVQGNLIQRFARAAAELRMRINELLSGPALAPGHIFNLGAGILPETPVEKCEGRRRDRARFKP